MKAAIYDFKRALLNKFTLALISLFIALGAVMAYTMAAVVIPSQSYLYRWIVVAEFEGNLSIMKVYGYVVNPEFESVEAPVKVSLVLVKSKTEESDGYVTKYVSEEHVLGSFVGTFVGTFEGEVKLEPLDEYVKRLAPNEFASLTLIISVADRGESRPIAFVMNGTLQPLQSPLWFRTRLEPVGAYDENNLGYYIYNVSATCAVHAITIEATIVPGVSASYVSRTLTGLLGIINSSELCALGVVKSSGEAVVAVGLGRTYESYSAKLYVNDTDRYYELGALKPGVNVFRVNLEFEPSANVSMLPAKLLILNSSGDVQAAFDLYLDASSHRAVRALLIHEISSFAAAGLVMFAAFSPIMVVYVCYALMAKPRGSGALEFVLARPVTRFDVYLTRFLAGILTSFAAPAIVIAAVFTAIALRVKILPDQTSIALLYLGIALNLASFYSVLYAIAARSRTSTFTALAAVIFIFFAFVYQGIALLIAYALGARSYAEAAKMTLAMNYFSPLGFYNIAQVLAMKAYLASLPNISLPGIEYADPMYMAAAAVAWILVPFAVGWLLFRRANLYTPS